MTTMTSNGLVSREELFADPVKRRFTEKTIEGFGKVRIRNLNAKEKAIYDSVPVNSKGKINIAAYTKAMQTVNVRLIIACVVDDKGNAIFTNDDIEKLMEMDAGVIEELATACGNHCGFLDEDAEKN